MTSFKRTLGAVALGFAVAASVSPALLLMIPCLAQRQEFGAEATLAYLRARALPATRKIADADAAILEFTRAIAVAPSRMRCRTSRRTSRRRKTSKRSRTSSVRFLKKQVPTSPNCWLRNYV